MRIADMLIVVGAVLLVIGILFRVFPMFGHLPGDIIIRGKNYSVYIPLVSSILLSVLLTIILNVIIRILGGWR